MSRKWNSKNALQSLKKKQFHNSEKKIVDNYSVFLVCHLHTDNVNFAQKCERWHEIYKEKNWNKLTIYNFIFIDFEMKLHEFTSATMKEFFSWRTEKRKGEKCSKYRISSTVKNWQYRKNENDNEHSSAKKNRLEKKLKYNFMINGPKKERMWEKKEKAIWIER